ncbi:TadE/TadG family type IV pilus assembly protein [Anaerocolumna xylanovorans]|uniref:TadE-like protein n=1 Tax=Anaerocolumna xylanovorans DSM 12503 TaxID=1121345 RepID=A0A1M7YJN4_9FIRM|nr:TadE/TadG family type IV pilus assembly protein [Anaerocolumna xylanovorans]SHO52822.1 TadE-like protein [Anaerocolumna xylanovorans DSM 12503]
MEREQNKTKNRIMAEDAFAIVEASIVFPVMFFVLFFIIFIGNAYYQIAQVDSCVAQAAIRGAQYVADPQQYDMKKYGTFPVAIKNVEPYRYILGEIGDGSINKTEKKVTEEVLDEVSRSVGFFSEMKPQVTSNESSIAEFHNYIIYATFSVQLNYEIKFPIKFLGDKEPSILKLASCAEVAVDDTTEFIRNVDMAIDLTAGTKAGQKISELFSKVNGYINKFSQK